MKGVHCSRGLTLLALIITQDNCTQYIQKHYIDLYVMLSGEMKVEEAFPQDTPRNYKMCFFVKVSSQTGSVKPSGNLSISWLTCATVLLVHSINHSTSHSIRPYM